VSVDTIKRFPGARVKFCGNVLYCANERTFAENLSICMQALSLITGMSIDELSTSELLTIEAYRSS
jgi:hypothetical protein